MDERIVGIEGVFKELCAEVKKIEKECSMAGWDGYSATPVHPSSIEFARQFLRALPPGTKAPSVGADPDGHITLEWYAAPDRVLSISVSPEGILHYASLGAARKFGSEVFSVPAIPEELLRLIRIF